MMLARTTSAVVGVVLVLSSIGCRWSGSGSEESTTSSILSFDAADDETTLAEPLSTSVTTSPNPAVGDTTIAATVPDEPVPGLTSDDDFCRAWSRFAGSFQALALASSVGADPANAMRLELVASSVVARAAADLEATLPEEVDAEREQFTEGLVGPFAARAALAVDELIAVGMTIDEVDELGERWLVALAQPQQDPDLVVFVSPAVASTLDDALASFSASVAPVNADPNLITDATAPDTLAYIASNCPDQGVLAGNDIVGD